MPLPKKSLLLQLIRKGMVSRNSLNNAFLLLTIQQNNFFLLLRFYKNFLMLFYVFFFNCFKILCFIIVVGSICFLGNLQAFQKKIRRRTSTTDELLYAQTNNSIVSSATIAKQNKPELDAIAEGS